MIVMVMYQIGPNNRFDLQYYMQKHIPLVRTLWGSVGLTRLQVLKGLAAPTGEPAAFAYVAVLDFESLDAFKAAAEAHGNDVMRDIANFTDVQPTLQFNEALD